MRKLILAVGLISGFACVHAQDSVSVLFIGNSYTYVNNLPGVIDSLASNLGKVVSYDSQALGGATFSTHAGSATTYTKINSKPWDYVVLQAQSQEPSFPDNQVNTQTLPYAIQLSDSIYANRWCSEVLFFMTWGRQDGDPQWEPISTYEGMQNRLRDAYVRFADSVQGSISPVGMAWKYVRANYPTINLYAADGSHPSFEGTYLAACAFYASLFRESPVGANFYGGLDPIVAGQLQLAAQIATLDSLNTWHLRPPSEHTFADFDQVQNGYMVSLTNKSWKAQSYFWNFGDGNTSLNVNPTHTYMNDGDYTVTLTASSECNTSTSEVTNTFNLGSIEENIDQGIHIIHSEDLVIISGLSGLYDFDLVDLTGRSVYNTKTSNKSINLETLNLVSGIHFVRIGTTDKEIVKRIYIE